MTDPISDMLARIRNAGTARHAETTCPSSRQKLAIARVLHGAGFLGDVRVEAREGRAVLVLRIRYGSDGRALIDGIRRISKPGRRVYVGCEDVPKVRNGLGVAAIHEHGVAAAATTYALCSDKGEVAIATHPDHRGRGLATAVGAAMLLGCRRRGLTPHWNAFNPVSQRLA